MASPIIKKTAEMREERSDISPPVPNLSTVGSVCAINNMSAGIPMAFISEMMGSQ
ncbi:MAG TPA: hypothetical protein VFC96_06965 [Anaerovoracaceae bacterium]|nr:hypothetical protein [Anaerovoracaceae bacterium]